MIFGTLFSLLSNISSELCRNVKRVCLEISRVSQKSYLEEIP